MQAAIYRFCNLLLLIWLPTLAYSESPDGALPDIGDLSGTIISPQKETELGENFMAQVRSAREFVDDIEINRYVQSLGYDLASHSDSPTQNFTFFVINDPQINAFAVPGGFIGVHAGLINATQNEGELAGVIAHEIAHISQKHMPRAIYDASQQSVPKAAALLASILLGVASPELGQAAIMTTMAGGIQGQINFTRANEQEADRIGMQTLYRSEYDPNGLPDFFEKLAKETRLYGAGVPEFLRTHPVTSTRIADSKGRAAQLHVPKPKDQLEFYFIRAKIIAISQRNPLDAVKAFKSQISQKSWLNEAGAHYGLAYAYVQSNQFKEAKTEFQRLSQQHKDHIGILNGMALVERKLGNYASSERTYQDALKLNPDNSLLTIGLAETYLDQRKANEAKLLLQPLLRTNPTSTKLYDLIIRSSELQDDLVDAHYYEAEKYYLLGQLELAVDHLKQANKIVHSDFVKKSRVEARLAQFESKLDLLEEEQKR